MTQRILLFLLLNFSALGLGGFFTPGGVITDWYAGLNRAPWTPPGWVFGFAWTSIMICFSFYMAILWPKADNKSLLITLYILQWILNVSWNPVFFYFHQVAWAMVLILLLTALIAYFFVQYYTDLKVSSFWIMPYLVWLIIACSLNAYIAVKN